MARAQKSWHDFFGQRRNIKRITSLIDGAKRLGKACPSFLFIGPAGTGKTAFGRAVAADFGSTLHYFQAGPEVDSKKIGALLAKLQYGDVFFLDEGHSLRAGCQELFYSALDDGRIPAAKTKGPEATNEWISLAEFTLIVATTQPSRLASPFKSRLMTIVSEPYEFRDLRAIAQRFAAEHDVVLTGQAASRVAEVSAGSKAHPAGTPRGVRSLIEELVLNFPGRTDLGLSEIEAVFTGIGIDPNGLWPHHRRYLLILQKDACSLTRLSNILGQDPKFITEEIEPTLFIQGLIEVSPSQGRIITAKGQQAVGEFLPRDEEKAQNEEMLYREAVR